jgi:phage repressor protein C with HTH and peptisase S24 domain
MLIENFAKKELTFMNKYKKNSNSAIDNGDHRRADTFSMANDDKRTIVAGEWKMPTSELQLLPDTTTHASTKKKTKITRNLVIKSDMEQQQSKATPVHLRGMSSATTMAMTMRASNSNSAFN